ncbi:hypothetical protein [Nocardia altamirensis]|uniref:hypothetical protein n=1 Tax=Nocardia altamirensis TaxID=472158 RepID=UPI00083FF01F|nr:hypothetical protein [Nocardia altamirensis]
MSANEDLLQAADLLEAATIGSVRLALAQSPHGPRGGRAVEENLAAVAGVLDRHRHLQEASMTIALVNAIYESQAAKQELTTAASVPGDAGDVAPMAEQVARIARGLLVNPAGTPLHQLGQDLAAIAEEHV